MDIDKDRLKELSDLFAEAEAKVKEVEEIDGDIVVPSINELRYVGYHLIRALASEHPSIEPELNKAADHARRAIYDAAEAQVIFFLEKVKSFQERHRKAASVTDVVSDYLGLMQQVEQAKKQISETRQRELPVSRSEYYQQCEPHIQALKKIVTQLDLAEPEIAKKERKSAQNFVLTVAAAVAGLIGASSTIAALIYQASS